MIRICTMVSLNEVESLLITGVNGFVGRSILERLALLEPLDLPGEIVLVTRAGIDFELPVNLSAITTVALQNLTSPWTLDFENSHIINLAADGSKSPYSEKASNDFRLIGRNLSDWLKSREGQPRVFHASSGACFAYKSLNLQDPLEGSKAEFISSRIDVENLLINDSELTGFELSIARLFTFSGNLLLKKNHYAITDFIKSGIGTGTVQVTGNPETVRSYMHQAAMAEWILQALVSPESERDLQIGASEPVTIGELAEFIAEQTGATVDYVPNARPKVVYLPKNEKTSTKLGLNEGLNWKLSVQEMIDTVRKGKDVSN